MKWSTSAAKVGRGVQWVPWCSASISTVGSCSAAPIVSRRVLLPAPEDPVTRMRRAEGGSGSVGPSSAATAGTRQASPPLWRGPMPASLCRLRARLNPPNQPTAPLGDTLGMLFVLLLGRDGLLPRATHIDVTKLDGCDFCHAHPFWLLSSITVRTTEFVDAISPAGYSPNHASGGDAAIASAAASRRASTFTDAMSESVNPSRSTVFAVSMPKATSSARTATETNDL